MDDEKFNTCKFRSETGGKEFRKITACCSQEYDGFYCFRKHMITSPDFCKHCNKYERKEEEKKQEG